MAAAALDVSDLVTVTDVVVVRIAAAEVVDDEKNYVVEYYSHWHIYPM